MNLVDPRFFKQDAHVGQWVDAMVRLQGAAVVPLAMTMIGDWMIETAESVELVLRSMPLREVADQGNVDVQVIPSGPGEGADGLLQMLLAVINSARQELVLTTPYFVPDESLLRALRGAAVRGVRVDMILPEKVDSLLTRYASRSYYSDLLEAGVRIHLYRNGLLHTKSITADQRISMFGTVNLDMRSLWLNYEVALFVYGTSLCGTAPCTAAVLHRCQRVSRCGSLGEPPGPSAVRRKHAAARQPRAVILQRVVQAASLHVYTQETTSTGQLTY